MPHLNGNLDPEINHRYIAAFVLPRCGNSGSSGSGLSEVYRFFNTGTGAYFFTSSSEESLDC